MVSSWINSVCLVAKLRSAFQVGRGEERILTRTNSPTQCLSIRMGDRKEGVKAEQAGGHTDAFIKTPDGKIKKLSKEAEYSFYETLKNKKIPDHIRSFFPKFYGIETIGNRRYICMEDITFGYKNPTIIDIKMGTSSVGEDATPEKRKEMEEKDFSTTTVTLGIRIVGGRIWNAQKKAYDVKKKDYGKSLKDKDIPDALKLIFSNGKELRKDVINYFLGQLRLLLEWFEEQSLLRFFSSSLLFVYEGEAKEVKATLKMIDFAHVSEIKDGGHDDGYIFGLKNLIKFLEDIVK
jgi:hypothetical protein